MSALKLTYLGTHWGPSGDLYYMTRPGGRQARVYVDSIGETWVDIRRIPNGGYFHSERVDGYRAFSGAEAAGRGLTYDGFTNRQSAPFAHRVHERP